jgi:AcrR family transcriptional regulator
VVPQEVSYDTDMPPDEQAPRVRGRPRSEAAGAKILLAARDLVLQHGYAGVTTDMIAKAAGSGKQTIYRRWPSKAELVLDAFAAHAADRIDQEDRTAMPVERALTAFLLRLFAALAETGRAVRGLMAYAQEDKAFRTQLFERLIRPRRQALLAVLAQGLEAGELPPDADLDATIAAIYGAMWYRLMLDEPLDGDFATRLAAFAIAGLHRPPSRQLV